MRSVTSSQFRKETIAKLDGQGIGRHTKEEVCEIGKKDVKAISDFLGGKPFLLGNNPTSLDATGYGFMANLFCIELPSVIADYAKRFDNLREYCDRLEAQYWT